MVGMEEIVPQEGVVETLKNSFVSESTVQSLDIDKKMILPIAIYGGIGFISGFLIKKYSEYFIALALLVLGLVVLQQFEYVDIAFNNNKIFSLLGIRDIPVSGNAYGTLLWEWGRSNVVSVVSLAAGFLVGMKVG